MKVNKLELDCLPKELIYLLRIVGKPKLSGQQIELQEDFNWSFFFKLIIHHRLFPGLSTKIKQKKMEENIPEPVLRSLDGWNQSNTFQMLKLTGEMDKLNQIFSSHHIQTLFLKGPFLGEFLYGNLSDRTSSDLDLLVPMKDLEVVENLLVQNGYVKDNYITTILNDWKWRHHHFSFIHSETNVKVEVHWRLNPGPGIEPSFKYMWQNRQELYVSNPDYPISFLGNELLFFFLVTHGSRHGWSRLRWLLDIDRMLYKSLDWEVIRTLFKHYHNLNVLEQALILAKELLGSDIQNPLRGKNEEDSINLANEALFYIKQMINLHDEPLPSQVSIYHKRHLVHLMSSKQKSLFYLSFLFPYPEDALCFPLPQKIHFLYFILRPIIWIWKKQKKTLYSRG